MLKLEQLRKLTAEVQDSYDNSKEGDGVYLTQRQLEDISDVLKWAEQQLNQRKKNTKTYLVRSKMRDKLLKEHLSKDEIEEINRQARERTTRLMEGEED